MDYKKLADKRNVENSEMVRKRLQAALERQLLRFKGTRLTCNAEMGPSEVREFCDVEPPAEKLLKAAMQQLHLSARAFHRVLKLARTIANLAECDVIAANHLAEAIQYRPRVGMWCYFHCKSQLNSLGIDLGKLLPTVLHGNCCCLRMDHRLSAALDDTGYAAFSV